MRKFFIYHHNDLDGYGAAEILDNILFSTFNDFKDVDYHFKAVDYHKNLPDINNDSITNDMTVYFLDYSFNPSTIHILKEFQKSVKNVIWIDHHKSSIDLINNNEELGFKEDVIGKNGIISSNHSGAYLTYLYCRLIKAFENIGLQYDFKPTKYIQIKLLNDIKIPKFIKLIDTYDRWQINDSSFNDAESFNYIMKNKLSEKTTWYDLIHDHESLDFLKRLINIGESIKLYITNDNQNYYSNNKYISSYNGKKCVVINRLSNSQIFGEDYYEFPFVVVWTYDGEKYKYTLYANDKSDVKCNEIAEQFGGGGHKGAAGFTSDKLIFTKEY